jgi:hypothetical protein
LGRRRSFRPSREKWFKVEEPGSLLAFGYSPKNSEASRHRALAAAIRSPKHSPLEVYRKLDGLAKVTERTQPENSAIYRADAEWIRSTYLNRG